MKRLSNRIYENCEEVHKRELNLADIPRVKEGKDRKKLRRAGKRAGANVAERQTRQAPDAAGAEKRAGFRQSEKRCIAVPLNGIMKAAAAGSALSSRAASGARAYIVCMMSARKEESRHVAHPGGFSD